MMRWIAILYAIGILAFELVTHSPLLRWWPVQVANIFGLWFYLPLPFIVLAVLLQRSARRGLGRSPGIVVLILVPLFLFVLRYGPLLLPPVSPLQADTDLRVMTWNVRIGNTDADVTAAAVLHEAPDVVVFQELGREMRMALRDRLQESYPYQAIAPPASENEFGIFSRYPLKDIRSQALGNTTCRCQQATLQLPTAPLTLFNVHLSLPSMDARELRGVPFLAGFGTQKQTEQVQTLLAEASEVQQPMLIMGDFNTTDRQVNYRRMRDRFRDAFWEAGWGFGLTFPATHYDWEVVFPVIRIDYVFHSPEWRARRVHLGEGGDADHRYVVADLHRSV